MDTNLRDMTGKNNSILLIGWFFYPQVGGVETIILNFALWLKEQGFVVTVLTSKSDGEKPDDKYSGIKIIRRQFMDTLSVYPSEKICEEMKTILNDVKPAIVHFHNGSYPSVAENMAIGARKVETMFEVIKSKHIPVIEHSHNAQLRSPEMTKKLRELNWDYLICVSKFVRDRWKKLGNNAKKIEVIYNGVDSTCFQPPEQRKDKKVLTIFFPARVIHLGTGLLDDQKRFMTVLSACTELVNSGITNFKLLAVLNFPVNNEVRKKASETKKNLDEFIENNNLLGKVDFIPSVPPDEMPNFYEKADVICVPSVNETFGMVYLEAMAAKRIAIASNTGGPKEYIENGQNGFLIEPDDSLGLAKILAELISDEKLRDNVAANAYQTAKKFDQEKSFQKILNIYEGFLR